MKQSNFTTRLIINSFLFIVIFTALIGSIQFSDNQIILVESKQDRTESIIQNELIPKETENNLNNEYSGIGIPLNLVHYANRTDSNISLQWNNGSSSYYGMPIGDNWEGEKLEVSLDNLRDKREWFNGSFDWNYWYDGSNGVGQNDTSDIFNPYQNWTFQKIDDTTNFENNFSGNFYPLSGKNSLELLLNGSYAGLTSYFSPKFGYDQHDAAQWTTQFSVPRGQIKDAQIKYWLYDNHTISMSLFEYQIYIDGISIYSIGFLSLKSFGSGWIQYSLDMADWMNTTNVFSGDLADGMHNITFRIEHIAPSGTISDFNFCSYQQLYLANPQLFITSDVKPQQINLTMNDECLNSTQYGQASYNKTAQWLTGPIIANFTSINNQSYAVYLDLTLNAFTKKMNQKTYFSPNLENNGTYFNSINNTSTLWEFYAYFSVPTAYKEHQFIMNLPGDWFINWVSTIRDPSLNLTNFCNFTVSNDLILPIQTVTDNPDGFWKFTAISPNYLLEMNSMKNLSIDIPSTDWLNRTIINSGEYLRFALKLKPDGNFTQLGNTSLLLELMFPDSTVWKVQQNNVSINPYGLTLTEPIPIPKSGGDYIAGEYTARVSWNNTYLTFNLNETGFIYTKFIIRHPSKLATDTPFSENVYDGTTRSIYFYLLDEGSGQVIQNGTVYCYNLLQNYQSFNEISAGYYFAQMYASAQKPGNNLIRVFGSHPFYLDCYFDWTMEVIVKAEIIAKTQTLTIAKGQNISLEFNYSQISTNQGLQNRSFRIEWVGNMAITEKESGQYCISADSSNTTINQIYTLGIYNQDVGFETKPYYIDIKVRSIETSIRTSENVDSYILKAGSDLHLEIMVENLDWDDYITGCEVIYESDLGNGAFTDMQNGSYSLDLSNVPDGEYILDIYVSKDQNYAFKSFQIKLYVINTIAGLPPWIIYSLIVAIVSLSGYIVMYQKMLRFPPIVRLIRNQAKLIQKGKMPYSTVKPMKDLFMKQYFESIRKEADSYKNHEFDFLTKLSLEKQPDTTKHSKQAHLTNSDKTSTHQDNLFSHRVSASRVGTDILKVRLVKMEEYRKQIEENVQIQLQIQVMEDRLLEYKQNVEDRDKIHNQINKTEKELAMQKSGMELLQLQKKQFPFIASQIARIPELEKKLETLNTELTQMRTKPEPSEEITTPPIISDGESTAQIQFLQGKLEQMKALLRAKQKMLMDLEKQTKVN